MKDRTALSCVLTLCLVFTVWITAPFVLMAPAEATADQGDAALASDFGVVGFEGSSFSLEGYRQASPLAITNAVAAMLHDDTILAYLKN